MAKQCVLYEDKICDDCGECERCDLDPSKLCDNCGKCLEGGANAEFRSMMIKRSPEPHSDVSDDGSVADRSDIDDDSIDGMDEFLDEPLDLETPEEIPVDPELLMQWENILSESFKKDPANAADDEPILRAVRRRRPRDAKRS